MIILKPAIVIMMAVVRYNHTPFYNSPSCIRTQPRIITEYQRDWNWTDIVESEHAYHWATNHYHHHRKLVKCSE